MGWTPAQCLHLMCLPVLWRLESKKLSQDPLQTSIQTILCKMRKVAGHEAEAVFWLLLLFLLAGCMGTHWIFFSHVPVSRCSVDAKRQNDGHVFAAYADPLGMAQL